MNLFSILVIVFTSVVISLPEDLNAFNDIPLQDNTGSRVLNKDDISKIRDQLRSPKNLRGLLVDDAILFDTSNLSLPKSEADPVILAFVQEMKGRAAESIESQLMARATRPTVDEAHRRYRDFIDEFDRDSEAKILAGVQKIFLYKPESQEYLLILLESLDDDLEDSTAEFFDDFFQVANAYKPATSERIMAFLQKVQSDLHILPKTYVDRAEKAYNSSRPSQQ
ncbi:hypothetical protein DSO57_1004950 [Entomophthora muscae]|uniref:Uncharacterized protein n=1 Tax=Entomophthora muscae TaxID=34485 RepID=A0ACC2T7S9_9FUNG|nr:hypothetical protein DSO57_1004950 [Entomophthora muscae]